MCAFVCVCVYVCVCKDVILWLISNYLDIQVCFEKINMACEVA